MSLVLQDALSALNPVLTIGDQLGELFRVHDGASKKVARARAARREDCSPLHPHMRSVADKFHLVTNHAW
jgi:ABC-type microcin C transport system duplicated ATPase subunit YejF